MRKREVQAAAKAIRTACHKRYDLVLPGWRGKEERLGGFCFIATQAFCHLTGAEPMRLYHHEGRPIEVFEHYYAVLNGEVWDLTAEQFDTVPDYTRGKPVKHRLTMRVQDLLQEV